MSDTFSSGDIAAGATATATAPVSEASPASAPVSSEQSAATTTPPASTVVPRDSSATEPPQERWPDILENTRKKTRAEVEAEFAYAKGVDRGEFDSTRQWMDLARRDPILALDRYVQQLMQHPTHAPQLKSYFGRSLGARTASDQMPGPDIPTSESQGQPVVYSAQQTQKLLEWQKRQFQQELDTRFGPIEQREKTARAESQATEYSQATLQALADKPGFKDHVAEIAERYAAIPVEDPRTEGEKLRDAYLEVVGPKLTSAAQRQAVADVHRKAGATTVNPAGGGASEPFDFKKSSWEEGLAHVWKQKGGGR